MSPGSQLLSLPVRGNVLPGALCVVGALGPAPSTHLRSLTPVPGRRSRRLSSTGAAGLHIARSLSGTGTAAFGGAVSSTVAVSPALPPGPSSDAAVGAAAAVEGERTTESATVATTTPAVAASSPGKEPLDLERAMAAPPGSDAAVSPPGSHRDSASGNGNDTGSSSAMNGAIAGLAPLGGGGGGSSSSGGELDSDGRGCVSPQGGPWLGYEVVAVVGTMDGVLTSTVIPARDPGLGTGGTLVPVRELDRLGSLACVVPWGSWAPGAPWLVAVANLEGDLRIVDIGRAPRCVRAWVAGCGRACRYPRGTSEWCSVAEVACRSNARGNCTRGLAWEWCG